MSLAKYYQQCGIPKGLTRGAVKAKARRTEKKFAAIVRAVCVDRDGHCRCDLVVEYSGDVRPERMYEDCDGPSEWAHMHARRRSKTRGMDPTVRHDTKYSLMLCHVHHELYDAKRLVITALTRKGADGPLKFRMAK